MSRTVAYTLLAAEATVIVGYHAWRYLRYLAEPRQGRPTGSEVYRVEPASPSTDDREYRLRFVR
jgi:hypothetical protein